MSVDVSQLLDYKVILERLINNIAGESNETVQTSFRQFESIQIRTPDDIKRLFVMIQEYHETVKDDPFELPVDNQTNVSPSTDKSPNLGSLITISQRRRPLFINDTHALVLIVFIALILKGDQSMSSFHQQLYESFPPPLPIDTQDNTTKLTTSTTSNLPTSKSNHFHADLFTIDSELLFLILNTHNITIQYLDSIFSCFPALRDPFQSILVSENRPMGNITPDHIISFSGAGFKVKDQDASDIGDQLLENVSLFIDIPLFQQYLLANGYKPCNNNECRNINDDCDPNDNYHDLDHLPCYKTHQLLKPPSVLLEHPLFLPYIISVCKTMHINLESCLQNVYDTDLFNQFERYPILFFFSWKTTKLQLDFLIEQFKIGLYSNNVICNGTKTDIISTSQNNDDQNIHPEPQQDVDTAFLNGINSTLSVITSLSGNTVDFTPLDKAFRCKAGDVAEVLIRNGAKLSYYYIIPSLEPSLSSQANQKHVSFYNHIAPNHRHMSKLFKYYTSYLLHEAIVPLSSSSMVDVCISSSIVPLQTELLSAPLLLPLPSSLIDHVNFMSRQSDISTIPICSLISIYCNDSPDSDVFLYVRELMRLGTNILAQCQIDSNPLNNMDEIDVETTLICPINGFNIIMWIASGGYVRGDETLFDSKDDSTKMSKITQYYNWNEHLDDNLVYNPDDGCASYLDTIIDVIIDTFLAKQEQYYPWYNHLFPNK